MPAVICCVVMVLLPQAAHASFMFDWSNKATSGFNAAETAVIEAAFDWWEMLITDLDGNAATADKLTITISEQATAMIGGVTAVTEAGMIPSTATMIVDDGTNEQFFVDLSPHESTEFNAGTVGHYGTAKPGSGAVGKIDLLSLIKHELGHAVGFNEDFTKWDAASNDATGVLTYGGNTINLLGTADSNELSHLDPTAAVLGLMLSAGSFDNPVTAAPDDGGFGDRRVQSGLDLDILSSIYGFTVDKTKLEEVPEPSTLFIGSISALMLMFRSRQS